jgi:hypothetical protein
MTEYKLPDVAIEAIRLYQSLDLGGKKIVCPYYINTKRNKDLRAMVGKGTPDEIITEARIWEKLKGVNFDSMSVDEIRQFLVDKGIGIDCSGFVLHTLDYWYKKTTGNHIWTVLKVPGGGFYSRLRYKLRPVEQLGANTITGDINSDPVSLNDVRPGDVIRSKWKKTDTHHIQLISRVVKDDNGNTTLIEYTHSTPYYGKANGVKTGEIRITDLNKTLKEQEWLEKDEHGVNFSYEGFLNNVEDNGLRRVRAMAKLINV